MLPRLFLLTIAVAQVAKSATFGAEFDSATLDFFEKKIRPVLAEKCYECHSAKAKRRVS